MRLTNKIIYTLLIGATTFEIISCNTSSVDPATTANKVAFEHATMKPLFDTYCASCHASGKSNYRDWPYVPSDYNASIKGYISTLYSEVYTRKTMPEGTKLTSAELAAFKAWYDAGYPAK